MNVLLDEAIKLPIPERIKLVEDIWDTIDEVLEPVILPPAQMAEIERRLEDYRKNPENVVSWEEVREGLRRIA